MSRCFCCNEVKQFSLDRSDGLCSFCVGMSNSEYIYTRDKEYYVGGIGHGDQEIISNLTRKDGN